MTAVARHGKHDSPIYHVREAMLQRCRNPKCAVYGNYGGRGVAVCERWERFENFYEDMGDPPNGMSLDRIDNDGVYSPGNCRWAARKQQQRNMRTNVEVPYRRKSVLLIDLFDRLDLPGLKYNAVHQRVRRGWSVERALTTKAQRRT